MFNGLLLPNYIITQISSLKLASGFSKPFSSDRKYNTLLPEIYLSLDVSILNVNFISEFYLKIINYARKYMFWAYLIVNSNNK